MFTKRNALLTGMLFLLLLVTACGGAAPKATQAPTQIPEQSDYYPAATQAPAATEEPTLQAFTAVLPTPTAEATLSITEERCGPFLTCGSVTPSRNMNTGIFRPSRPNRPKSSLTINGSICTTFSVPISFFSARARRSVNAGSLYVDSVDSPLVFVRLYPSARDGRLTACRAKRGSAAASLGERSSRAATRPRSGASLHRLRGAFDVGVRGAQPDLVRSRRLRERVRGWRHEHRA